MKTERWALSETEFLAPAGLCSHDELIATLPGLNSGIIVDRCGNPTNRWEDGTKGVPEYDANLASEADCLYHPKTDEETAIWLDVEVRANGDFHSLHG